MHHCEEFREQITEHIIEGRELAEEFRDELLICSACSDFYIESRDLMGALSAVDLSIPEQQWDAMEYRLRMRLLGTVGAVYDRRKTGAHRAPLKLLAAAAMLLITAGLYRLATPLVDVTTPPVRVPQAVYTDRGVPLDPVTVDFLEESELLLRNVMKMSPDDIDDLAEAKKAANGQLANIEQRKEAAADLPPIIDVMDTYETVLRDIRNLDERSAAEDISDIQSRIRKNGLIANIKAFEPSITPASFAGR